MFPEPGRPAPPKYLADQLTLLQPGRADNPHLLPIIERYIGLSAKRSKNPKIVYTKLKTS